MTKLLTAGPRETSKRDIVLCNPDYKEWNDKIDVVLHLDIKKFDGIDYCQNCGTRLG